MPFDGVVRNDANTLLNLLVNLLVGRRATMLVKIRSCRACIIFTQQEFSIPC